jgi:RNA polymerase sigma-70 factor, ECF subfamily
VSGGDTETFEQQRSLLMGVAYRMLGTVADSEDVVQEAWLRWSRADTSDVVDPRGFLVRTTTRLAIDRLRHVRSRREAYIGSWLPEPLATDLDHTVPDTAQSVLRAESVSLALLVVLESLSPAERAVFVLREAFTYPYAEIARILDRSEAAVRQMGVRARAHVDERRSRFEAGRPETEEVTRRFLAACSGGALKDLLAVLAPDVRLVSDAGGKAKAPRRVIAGASSVGRFLIGILVPDSIARFLNSFPTTDDTPHGASDMEVGLIEANGAPALLATSRGTPVSLVVPEVADGRIHTLYLIANPDKLGHLMPRTA